MEKGLFAINSVGRIGYLYFKKLDFYLTSYTKIISRCTVYPNEKCKTTKLLEDRTIKLRLQFTNIYHK